MLRHRGFVSREAALVKAGQKRGRWLLIVSMTSSSLVRVSVSLRRLVKALSLDGRFGRVAAAQHMSAKKSVSLGELSSLSVHI